ncbi:hypothetical protein DSL72_009488 [Monilinia vaccinii-corymbosi]|uniref:F-box domain-containing protein n=1 Tax=Monilinia vaccinii-corymbosi TaxID=61207 RepID=A0A8A3PQH2_9HELO|nr:hypothetical protein DSL72_009488 [Monilinia vaccinii-corymbosi]
MEYKDLLAFMVKFLEMTPNLQSLRWSNQGIYKDVYRTFVLQEPCIINQLKQQPGLRNLWIEFSPNEGPVYCWPRLLEAFCNLTSLDLYNFTGDRSHITAELARCLVNCPNLRSLGLGQRGHDAEHLYVPRLVVIEGEDGNFLEQLCLLYHTRYESHPLNLHTLRLGYGTSPYAPKLKENHNYLKRLVCTRKLRTLDIFNGRWIKSLEDYPGNKLPIDYQLLDDCDSLANLSVTDVDDDLKDWLSDKRRSSIRTISVANYSDKFLGPSYELDLPNISSIIIRMFDAQWYGPVGDWHAEDLISQFAIPKYTILDNLSIKGLQCLSRLTLSIHYRKQWDHLYSRLADLKSLKQLRLDPLFEGTTLSKARSLDFSNAKCDADIAYIYAQEISKICPSLRYLMISLRERKSSAWEIIPAGEGAQGRRLQGVILKDIDSFEHFPDIFDIPGKVAGLRVKSICDGFEEYPFLVWAQPDNSDYSWFLRRMMLT